MDELDRRELPMQVLKKKKKVKQTFYLNVYRDAWCAGYVDEKTAQMNQLDGIVAAGIPINIEYEVEE
jgi:hypothetical protein